MNNIYILKEISKFDRSVWRLFSLLNKEMNDYFNVKSREYEMCFRTINVKRFEIIYKLDGSHHRSDGPAVIYNTGSEEWYFNGQYHRLNGPAVIYIDHNNHWYINGKLHRLDGPAIEYVKEHMKKFNEWYINGKRIK